MGEVDHKEIWALKNWCFWAVLLEKTLESPLDCKKIQPFSPKGNQSWLFIGRSDAEAETLTLWPPDMKSWLIGKDPDAEKDWRQEPKGTTDDEMVGLHHWLNGHEFEMVKDRKAWCAAVHWVTDLDMTEWLNNNCSHSQTLWELGYRLCQPYAPMVCKRVSRAHTLLEPIWVTCDSSMWKWTVAQSCPTLCDLMDYSPPGSSIHGIF